MTTASGSRSRRAFASEGIGSENTLTTLAAPAFLVRGPGDGDGRIDRVADHEFKKTQPNLKVTLEIDNQLTWGELYRFVDLARKSGYPDDGPVLPEMDLNDPSLARSLVMYLDADDLAGRDAASDAPVA
jgi:hypothetical protein